ncbi:DsbA family protein [Chitinophaga rhizophila]|uniref:DsbA family protein n=1 Tax=Chitinophaga rhizophila TaxID=2866212 RepID=A0ABS7G8D1_9BACT|nr:DsbA family protein [Chitinophaga rhizophila]MBW8683904.1 DsbA family protein [Chitinophaga rhizophila]
MKLIYIYDALCGWCYGFTPVIEALQQHLGPDTEVEVLSGGMLRSANHRPASAMYNYIKEAHKQVETTSGVQFGQAFLEEYLRTDDIMDSEKPSIALTVFKEYLPQKALAFAHDMQIALNYEGKSLNEDATYRTLIAKYQLPVDAFLEKMKDDAVKYDTIQEFNQVEQWGITGFPAAIFDDGKEYFLIAKGYTPLEILIEVIDKIKQSS